MVTPLLDQRDIKYTVFFNADSVDTERQVISSMEGEEVPYDLLVMVPPHRGAKVIEDSGLGDPQGWIPTHRDTLEVKGAGARLRPRRRHGPARLEEWFSRALRVEGHCRAPRRRRPWRGSRSRSTRCMTAR